MPTRKLVVRYEQDLELFPDRWHRIGVCVFAAFLVGFPLVASDYWLGISLDAMVAVVGAVAMMILTGFAGQVSLGHAAFIGLGAYTVSILGSIYGVPFWLALPVAGVVSTLVGLSVGPFALRLEGLYLAIVTVGLLFLVQHGIKQGVEPYFDQDSFLASMHLWFVSDPAERAGLGAFFDDALFFGVTVSFKQKLYILFIVLTLGVIWISRNIQYSRIGRAMMAVRDRDTTAAVLGVNPAHVKFVAFGVSSFLAGIAGGMYAFAHPTISLDVTTGAPFSLTMSVLYLAMVVLGGVGTTFGAVWGAVCSPSCSRWPRSSDTSCPFPTPSAQSSKGRSSSSRRCAYSWC